MQEVTIHIPNDKMALFLEIAHTLGLKVDKCEQTNLLTPEQVMLVEEERKKIKTDPAHFLDWEEARKSIKFD